MRCFTEKIEQNLVSQVKEIGAELMKVWPGSEDFEDQKLKVTCKPDGSYVTSADLASHEKLTEVLTSLFPGDGILSEEGSERTDFSEVERVWIIDPIDGTNSFVSGCNDFSILCGLCVGSEACFGLMYFPALDILALAHRGLGAFINGSLTQVSSSEVPRESGIYVKNVEGENPNFYCEKMDSGMAFLGVCNGGLDGALIRLIQHPEWDVVAPSIILEESGGRITDEQGQRLSFSRSGTIDANYIVASNSLIHPFLLNNIAHLRVS